MSRSLADASPPGAARPRRAARPADTVARLVAATVDELAAVGYPDLTVRGVARRAGVAPATAYTYFSSKDHLVTEAFWQHVQALPELPPEPARARHDPAARASLVLTQVADLVAGIPHLATACTSAMLAPDPDVAQLRDRIGADLHRRLAEAVAGPAQAAQLDATLTAQVDAIELALTGALVRVGMGHLRLDQLADRMTAVTHTILGRTP